MRPVPAIILAAGESKRMGRPKALLPFRGGTFLSTLAETLGSFCSPVIAVFGFEGDSLCKSAPQGVRPIVNYGYKAGMLTSLQTGLRALDLSSFDRILFTPVDHPAVLRETVATLLDLRASIAIPKYRGKRGHPVLIGTAIAAELLADPPEAKVRYTIDRHASEIEYTDIDDPGIVDDIDDPALYQALLERETLERKVTGA